MPYLPCCHADCPVHANVELPLEHIKFPIEWYCQKHRDITMFQPKTLRKGAGADLVIKSDLHEAEIKKLREALTEIKSTVGIRTGPIDYILNTIRRLACEALGDD